MAANSRPSRARASPAMRACFSPFAVSRRSASCRAPWGSASPWRRSQSCCAIKAAAYRWSAGLANREREGTSTSPSRRAASITPALSTIVDTHDEAARLDLPPLLVRRPLEAFLDERGLGSGPVEAEPIGDGHSNITYVIRRDGGEWVLRPPPRPPLPPSAHDVLREARLLSAVEDEQIRTPRVLATCDDDSVIGAHFYVMEKIDGDVIVSEIPARLDNPAQRARMAEELMDSLVEIHAVDWRACGLEGYGKPSGYLERQVRRFSGLWDHNKTREVAEVDEGTAWLAANMPESPEATIVHGDYRLGNTMMGPGTPARLVAIFDWELATIGDPLADVGYLTATYAEPGEADGEATPMSALNAVTTREGFP